jgi:hypothetical protein
MILDFTRPVKILRVFEVDVYGLVGKRVTLRRSAQARNNSKELSSLPKLADGP